MRGRCGFGNGCEESVEPAARARSDDPVVLGQTRRHRKGLVDLELTDGVGRHTIEGARGLDGIPKVAQSALHCGDGDRVIGVVHHQVAVDVEAVRGHPSTRYALLELGDSQQIWGRSRYS